MVGSPPVGSRGRRGLGGQGLPAVGASRRWWRICRKESPRPTRPVISQVWLWVRTAKVRPATVVTRLRMVAIFLWPVKRSRSTMTGSFRRGGLGVSIMTFAFAVRKFFLVGTFCWLRKAVGGLGWLAQRLLARWGEGLVGLRCCRHTTG